MSTEDFKTLEIGIEGSSPRWVANRHPHHPATTQPNDHHQQQLGVQFGAGPASGLHRTADPGHRYQRTRSLHGEPATAEPKWQVRRSDDVQQPGRQPPDPRHHPDPARPLRCGQRTRISKGGAGWLCKWNTRTGGYWHCRYDGLGKLTGRLQVGDGVAVHRGQDVHHPRIRRPSQRPRATGFRHRCRPEARHRC